MKEFTLTVVLDEQKDNDQGWSSLHQCLLMLFDSPLSHAGYLEVYIKLADARTIRLHKEIRIPRTFKRFEQLFNNFLQGCDMPVVQTKDGPTRLIELVNKQFIERQILNKCQRFRVSNLAPKLRDITFFTEPVTSAKRVVLFIEFGPVDFNILGEGRETEYEVKTINKQYSEDTFSISRYPLSPSLTCVKLTTAFEKALDVSRI